MEVKQLIVMRKDLNMRKGKIAAQAGHAALGAYLATVAATNHKNYLDDWLNKGHFTKICVYVNSEEEIRELERKAKGAGIICKVIVDAGFTEFHGEPTITCMGFEPLPAEIIDPITGDLPLY